MTDREELRHLINHTELIPPVVEELAETVKKALSPAFNSQAYPGKADSQVRIISLSPKLDNAKSREVAAVNVDTHNAVIIAWTWGAKTNGPEDKFPSKIIVEFQDPECFDKIEAWVKKLCKAKFWYDR